MFVDMPSRPFCRIVGAKTGTDKKKPKSPVHGAAIAQAKQGQFEYTAGGVISRETFPYGYYEARFRCPPGAGWHTSFRMMRHDWRRAVDEAAAVQKIDVCEQDSVNRTSYSVNLQTPARRVRHPQTGSPL